MYTKSTSKHRVKITVIIVLKIAELKIMMESSSKCPKKLGNPETDMVLIIDNSYTRDKVIYTMTIIRP